MAEVKDVFLWFTLHLINFCAKELFVILKNLFFISAFISTPEELVVGEFLLSSWAFPFV